MQKLNRTLSANCIRNKRAMSEVVTTSVLIILALASVTLAGYTVLNLVKAGNIQSSPTYNCLDLQTEITPTIKLAKACLNTEGEIEALIQRSSKNLNIESLSFVLAEETWTCSEPCAESCEVLQAGTSRIYYLVPDQNSLDKTLEVYIGTCKIDEIKVSSCP